MCKCNSKTEIGNYGNQVIVLPPFSNEPVSIDRCILDEISILWAEGIITTGSCCGHNQQNGFIGVQEQCIPDMFTLGYETYPNSSRPDALDSFKLKSYSNLSLYITVEFPSVSKDGKYFTLDLNEEVAHLVYAKAFTTYDMSAILISGGSRGCCPAELWIIRNLPKYKELIPLKDRI